MKYPFCNHKNSTMKKYAFLFLLIAVIFSCNTKQPDKTVSKTDTTVAVSNADTASIKTDSHYFWAVDQTAPKGLVMMKTRPIPADSLTASMLINMLNETYPDIKLQFSKISHDSIFIKILKSAYLTQQIGSSGAEGYLAEVTYNLTELKNINFVDIRFKQGDHATPGTYSRTDFVHEK
jgi:hypothetical protein